MLLQFLLCGSAFLLLVVIKLLLPANMEQLQKHLGSAMEQNMDVRAVFSAVGRAFSGESDVEDTMDEVYRAVFAGEGEAVEASVTVSPVRSERALEMLRPYRSAGETASEDGEAGTDTPDPSYILYSEENLPERVSMEQAILGFDYCVPVAGSISSPFGYREHPVEGEDKFHYGVDLAADTGTAVQCFADGTVTAVGESSSYGKYCIVAHAHDYSTLYAHCSRITAASGAAVRRGDKIAEVGSTGMATGPHLHFELQQNGTYLNPIYYVAAL